MIKCFVKNLYTGSIPLDFLFDNSLQAQNTLAGDDHSGFFLFGPASGFYFKLFLKLVRVSNQIRCHPGLPACRTGKPYQACTRENGCAERQKRKLILNFFPMQFSVVGNGKAVSFVTNGLKS